MGGLRKKIYSKMFVYVCILYIFLYTVSVSLRYFTITDFLPQALYLCPFLLRSRGVGMSLMEHATK